MTCLPLWFVPFVPCLGKPSNLNSYKWSSVLSSNRFFRFRPLIQLALFVVCNFIFLIFILSHIESQSPRYYLLSSTTCPPLTCNAAFTIYQVKYPAWQDPVSGCLILLQWYNCLYLHHIFNLNYFIPNWFCCLVESIYLPLSLFIHEGISNYFKSSFMPFNKVLWFSINNELRYTQHSWFLVDWLCPTTLYYTIVSNSLPTECLGFSLILRPRYDDSWPFSLLTPLFGSKYKDGQWWWQPDILILLMI